MKSLRETSPVSLYLKLNFNIVFSSHWLILPVDLCNSGSPNKTAFAFPIPCMHAISLSHLILTYFIIIILYEGKNFWNALLCNFVQQKRNFWTLIQRLWQWKHVAFDGSIIFFRRFKVRIGLEIGECLRVVLCYATFSPERPTITYYFLVRQIVGLAWDGS